MGEAMRRRSRAGGKPIKTRRRKAATLSSPPKVSGRRKLSITNADAKIALLKRERDEALEQQTAISEILHIIARAPGDLSPVFEAMLASAMRICEAQFGNLWLYDGDAYRVQAMRGAPPNLVEQWSKGPLRWGPNTGLGRLAATKKIVHIADVTAEKAYAERDPLRVATADILGARTFLAAPMLKAGELIGAIVIYRKEVRRFSEKQIALVKDFAAQAVIAIENTRLLNELRQRTDDLTESLEQQTATSEVLQVISSSPGELEPVFQKMLANAVRICDAKFGTLFRVDNETVDAVAKFNLPPALAEFLQPGSFQPPAGTALDHLLRTKDVVRVADELTQAVLSPPAKFGGARSLVAVPMLKEDALIGAIIIYRQEVRPFSDKQIELVKNFAAQAVIAIENTRLLNELRESLEQQTATSEVLSVISSSPGKLEPVFQSMLENATRICEASFGSMLLRDGNAYRRVALHNAPPACREFSNDAPVLRRGISPSVDRVFDTKQVCHILDVATEDPNEPIAKFGGARTLLVVPMLKDNDAIGLFGIYRQEVRPFTDKQIALVQNFANQAVIAVENTRLLNELRQRTDDLTESLEQQTATSEVLRVISSSPGDLEPVFQAMLENATRICEAKFGTLFRFDGQIYHLAAQFGTPPEFAELQRRRGPFQTEPGTQLDLARRTKRVSHTADYAAEAVPGNAAKLGGARSTITVPMLKDDEFVGAFSIYRQEVRPFSDKQIELVQNFAAQAVIAIENTRLLNELRQSLEQQTATAEVLSVISSSPGDLEPVFQTMLENAVRICEAKFGSLVRFDGENFHFAAEVGTPPEYATFQKDRGPLRPRSGTQLERVLRTKQVCHSDDYAAETVPGYAATLGGARSTVYVPMLKDDVLIGVINIYRQEVRPFTDKQIELVQNFAAQAVIAIENTRLLSELRQSLEQQTATADVLRVISSSPGELEPVFDAMLSNVLRICDAKFGNLALFDGKELRMAAMQNAPPAFEELRRGNPVIALDRSVAGPVIIKKQVNHVHDLAAEEPYAGSILAKVAGARSALAVPLLRDDAVIGTFAVYRQEVRPFTAKQIDLLKNFAAQAVIAIENTRLLNELRQRTDDLTESLEQQTATSEVLGVVSSSQSAVQPVLETVVESAARLCEAQNATIHLREGDVVVPRAQFGPLGLTPIGERLPLNRHWVTGHAVLEARTIHVPDLLASDEYPEGKRMAGSLGHRATLVVPLLREGIAIGAILLRRREARPFTERQIALVQNFAAQVVIAIENTRLLNELRDSLERQTATSEVLSVISSSPGQLEPVFQAILENATRICAAKFGGLWMVENDGVRLSALSGASPDFAEFMWRTPLIKPGPLSAVGRALKTKQTAQIDDLAAGQGYIEGDYLVTATVDIGGGRTLVAVPMMKEDEVVGAITIYRQEVQPFTNKEIELVQNFAAQAVIAIENTRLLNELRESLEQQTATADVLRVISSTPGELEPVFKAMLENAVRICDAKFGTLFRFDGESADRVASVGTPATLVDFQLQRGPFRPDDAGNFARCLKTKTVVHVADELAEPKPGVAAVHGGARSTVHVPMLKDNEPVGAIVIYRQEVRPFTDKQIALLQNFSAQAVIAIENTRLLNELRQRTEDLSESLEQQTATSKVLEVISRSAFDLHAVFETVAESSVRLCGADRAFIFRFDGELLRMAVAYNSPPEFTAWVEQHPIRPGRHSGSARAALERRTIHIPDVRVDPEYTYGAKDAEAIRTVLGVPILKGDDLLGVMMIYHLEIKPFTDNQIALVETFADQAAIAIENVRLFEEIQDKSRQLEVASQHKSQFLANMSHELRTPLNAILGYTELMADGIYGELPEKTMGVLKRLESNGRHLLGLINDVLDLSKIEAGQLVLELTDYSLEDIAQTVRSTLEPLAADKKLAFKVDVAPKLPAGHGDGRRLTQVVINLVGNAIKFTDAGEVVITATATDGSFHLSVRDTGPGISAADQAKLFQEFQQADSAITRKKGGTGLGLAISKRIIEMHGGKIWLESQVGQGSTFSFTIPVRVAQQVVTA